MLTNYRAQPPIPWLAAACATGVLCGMWTEDLLVHVRDQELRVTAPRFHFLSGAPVNRLRNGAAVPFDFQLSLAVDTRSNLFDRALERFVVSYDLWEEKYSVTKLWGAGSIRGASNSRTRERRSVSHLSAEGVENWCIDNVALSTSGLDPNRRVWVRLEVRTTDPRDGAPLVGESGISINRLIELFSHPPHSGQQRWTVESGPMRLADLRGRSGG